MWTQTIVLPMTHSKTRSQVQVHHSPVFGQPYVYLVQDGGSHRNGTRLLTMCIFDYFAVNDDFSANYRNCLEMDVPVLLQVADPKPVRPVPTCFIGVPVVDGPEIPQPAKRRSNVNIPVDIGPVDGPKRVDVSNDRIPLDGIPSVQDRSCAMLAEIMRDPQFTHLVGLLVRDPLKAVFSDTQRALDVQ